jgi:hypothetical protein
MPQGQQGTQETQGTQEPQGSAQQPSKQEIPKTKEEWLKLSRDDTEKYLTLTQERMDMTIRQNRELQEKLELKEKSEKNLMTQIEAIQKKYSSELPEEAPSEETREYRDGSYPRTQEEWDELFLSKPTFASDLRNRYLSEINRKESDFIQTFNESARLVQKEHPDMYILELDDTGKPKKDEQGKPILKINPVTGFPDLNLESEKGKLWIEIWNEDKEGWKASKIAPKLIMAEMERRLRTKGAAMVKKENEPEEAAGTDVAAGGVTPPEPSSSKFNSQEEKAHVEKQIARGVYKNIKEYFQWRDNPPAGYAEENRMPDFSKKQED